MAVGSPVGRAARPRHALTAEALGRRILGGELRPGVTLPNSNVLARQFALSRPALREAIKLLAGKGLVECSPRRGTVVRPSADWNRLDSDVLAWAAGEMPDAAFVRDLFELRRMIEPEAASLAASRGDPAQLAAIGGALAVMASAGTDTEASIAADVAFHQAILLATGNRFLAAFAPAIATTLAIAFDVQRRGVPGHEHFVPRHRAIAEAIGGGDGALARGAMQTLLQTSEADALAGLTLRDARAAMPAGEG